MKLIDLTGQRFGRLVVTGQNREKAHMRWDCVCDCGNVIIAESWSLRTGRTKSCRCLISSRLASGALRKTHGLTGTAIYRVWQNMKTRCNNPKSSDYANYGSRGITIDPRWVGSFDAFLTDMGNRPSPKHTLDRVDNDGPYTQSNCRWVLRAEQNRNKRSNIWVTYDGQRTPLVDVAKALNAAYLTIYQQYRAGRREWHATNSTEATS